MENATIRIPGNCEIGSKVSSLFQIIPCSKIKYNGRKLFDVVKKYQLNINNNKTTNNVNVCNICRIILLIKCILL